MAKQNESSTETRSSQIVRACSVLVSLVFLTQLSWAATPYQLAPTVWQDVNGTPLPFQTLDAIEQYLKTAPIIENDPIPTGTTDARKLLLDRDGIQLHACFRHVSIDRKQMRLGSGKVVFDFRDEAIFEVAAYQLSKLLSLNNIPPVVERAVGRREGTVQIWIDGATMEQERLERKIQPPNLWRWAMQQQILYLFDNLIYNDDRNLGNILIDSQWKLWMIDHTRGFRRYKQLPAAQTISCVEAGVWAKLKALDEETIRMSLSPYLKRPEVNALIERKHKLVEYIEKMIEARGEVKVLYHLLVYSNPDS